MRSFLLRCVTTQICDVHQFPGSVPRATKPLTDNAHLVGNGRRFCVVNKHRRKFTDPWNSAKLSEKLANDFLFLFIFWIGRTQERILQPSSRLIKISCLINHMPSHRLEVSVESVRELIRIKKNVHEQTEKSPKFFYETLR